MIDFKYHIVSIVAVFLAAAVGIVLGTTTLNGVVLRDLQNRVSSLSHDKDTLHQQLEQARTSAQRDDAFASALVPQVVADRLAGRSVVVVRAPGASASLAQQVEHTVTAAGAQVSAVVDVQPAYADPANAAVVGDVARRVAPTGVSLDAGSNAAAQAAAVIAGVLMTRDTTAVTTDGVAALQRVLAGFADAGLLQLEGTSPRPGDLAVVISADAPTNASPSASSSATVRPDSLLDLVGRLDALGDGTVVAGTTAAVGQGSLLSAVRGSGLAEEVSTVDSADGPRGLIATVLALAAQTLGVSGAYGQAAPADAPLPTSTP